MRSPGSGAHDRAAPAVIPASPVGALGTFQRRNFALARAAAEAYLGGARPGGGGAAAAEVRVPGRLQIVGENPLTLLDGAHNPDGMAALAESLPEMVAGHDRIVAVVSILDDKDAAGMLALLMPNCDALVLTSSQNPARIAATHPAVPGRQLRGPPPRSSATPRGGASAPASSPGPTAW